MELTMKIAIYKEGEWADCILADLEIGDIFRPLEYADGEPIVGQDVLVSWKCLSKPFKVMSDVNSNKTYCVEAKRVKEDIEL